MAFGWYEDCGRYDVSVGGAAKARGVGGATLLPPKYAIMPPNILPDGLESMDDTLWFNSLGLKCKIVAMTGMS